MHRCRCYHTHLLDEFVTKPSAILCTAYNFANADCTCNDLRPGNSCHLHIYLFRSWKLPPLTLARVPGKEQTALLATRSARSHWGRGRPSHPCRRWRCEEHRRWRAGASGRTTEGPTGRGRRPAESRGRRSRWRRRASCKACKNHE